MPLTRSVSPSGGALSRSASWRPGRARGPGSGALQPTTASTRRAPGADRRLAGQRQRADLRAAADVGATAELARPRAADLDDAHLLAVGLAEQRQRAERPRLGQRHVRARTPVVGADGGVGDVLDVAALLRASAPCQAKSSRR